MLAKTSWFRSKEHSNEEESEEHAGGVKVDENTDSKRHKSGTPGYSRRMEKREQISKSMNNTRPSTVMFVPWTIGGKLAAKLRAMEDRLAKLTGFRIKYTEEGAEPSYGGTSQPNWMLDKNVGGIIV